MNINTVYSNDFYITLPLFALW